VAAVALAALGLAILAGALLRCALTGQNLAVNDGLRDPAHRPGYHLPVGPLVWLNSAWFLGIAAGLHQPSDCGRTTAGKAA